MYANYILNVFSGFKIFISLYTNGGIKRSVYLFLHFVNDEMLNEELGIFVANSFVLIILVRQLVQLNIIYARRRSSLHSKSNLILTFKIEKIYL